MSTQELLTLAKTFFDSIAAGDVETAYSCFAPGAEIWHSNDEAVVTREFTKVVLTAMHKRIRNVDYGDRRLDVFPGGFVQQHVLKGVRKHDGVEVRLSVAVICRVKDGKITRLDEYFDSARQLIFADAAPKVPNISVEAKFACTLTIIDVTLLLSTNPISLSRMRIIRYVFGASGFLAQASSV